MQKSEQIDLLTAAAVTALATVSHPVKNKRNPHFKNTYADLMAVVECSRDALLDNGLWVIQVPEGNGIATMITHTSGQFLYFQATLPDAPQKFGSGLTYFRRYGTQGLAMIVAEEDDDAEAAEGRGSNEENW